MARIVGRRTVPWLLSLIGFVVLAPLAVISPLGGAFGLAAMAPLVTIGGSLVTALALSEGAVAPDAAFELTHLDEAWQAERWGEDQLAAETRAARRRDFMAAAALLTLL